MMVEDAFYLVPLGPKFGNDSDRGLFVILHCTWSNIKEFLSISCNGPLFGPSNALVQIAPFPKSNIHLSCLYVEVFIK